jgi:hypothetical protein
MNSDKMGAVNIGTNSRRLVEGRPTIRTVTEEDFAFQRIPMHGF